MKLIILNLTDKEFNNFIMEQMKEWFYNNLDVKKLVPAQTFVDTFSQYKSIYRKNINLKDICFSAISLLKADVLQNETIIRIDPAAKIYGLNISLSSIISLINYGNIVVKPYPIFDEMFNHFSKNINAYFIMYKEKL